MGGGLIGMCRMRSGLINRLGVQDEKKRVIYRLECAGG